MTERLVDAYRPQRLDDVIGQAKAVSQLSGLLSSQKIVGNTILISGPYGTGKTTLGRILAKAVNCERAPEGPCGECRSCLIPVDQHSDIKEINAADARGIDDIRSLIEVSRLAPRRKARVFILDEAHQISGPGAQAFLKILEEPPKHCLFVLCTTDPYKLLPTIRSRSVWIKLAEVPSRDVARLLTRVCKAEGYAFDKSIVNYIVEMSAGHVRDALMMLEQLGAAFSSLTLDEAKEQLPQIAEGILGASPETLVPKYVTRLLNGSVAAMVYLRKVENPEYFLALVLRYLKEMAIYYREPDLVDNPSLVSFVQALKVKTNAKHLTALFDIHLQAQERVKNRSVDPLDAIDLAILKCVEL